MKTGVIVGSRASKLALIQTETAVAEIRNSNPDVEISISRFTTRGDRERHKPFDEVEGSGVFVKELETALLAGEIDLAIHSLKDMLTELPDGLSIGAVMKRADPRDALVSAGGKRLSELPAGAVIGTGSPRRAAQLAACRPDLSVRSIRGNVDSRLRRVEKGECAAIIIAAAGLIRLGLEGRITEYLPEETFLPAVGQGAMAVEIRSDDEETARLVSPLNHLLTWQSVTAERAFLRALGGGCRAPIAALGTVEGRTLSLTGMVSDPEGKEFLKATDEGNASDAEIVGVRLAERLLGMGAAEFMVEKAR